MDLSENTIVKIEDTPQEDASLVSPKLGKKDIKSELSNEEDGVHVVPSLSLSRLQPTRKVDSKTLFCCASCKYETPDKQILLDHLAKMHQDKIKRMCHVKKYNCIKCGLLKTNSRSRFESHSCEDNTTKNFRCGKCDYRTNKKFLLRSHLKTHSRSVCFACEHCSFTTTWKHGLSRHMKVHEQSKLYCCPICTYDTVFKSNFTYHMKAHTGKLEFRCEMCSFRSNWRHCLNNHMRVHQNDLLPTHKNTAGIENHCKNDELVALNRRKYQQEDGDSSGNKIKEKYDYEELLRLLDKQQDLQCNICGYMTNSSKLFKRHIESNHPGSSNSCEKTQSISSDKGHI